MNGNANGGLVADENEDIQQRNIVADAGVEAGQNLVQPEEQLDNLQRNNAARNQEQERDQGIVELQARIRRFHRATQERTQMLEEIQAQQLIQMLEVPAVQEEVQIPPAQNNNNVPQEEADAIRSRIKRAKKIMMGATAAVVAGAAVCAAGAGVIVAVGMPALAVILVGFIIVCASLLIINHCSKKLERLRKQKKEAQGTTLQRATKQLQTLYENYNDPAFSLTIPSGRDGPQSLITSALQYTYSAEELTRFKTLLENGVANWTEDDKKFVNGVTENVVKYLTAGNLRNVTHHPLTVAALKTAIDDAINSYKEKEPVNHSTDRDNGPRLLNEPSLIKAEDDNPIDISNITLEIQENANNITEGDCEITIPVPRTFKGVNRGVASNIGIGIVARN